MSYPIFLKLCMFSCFSMKMCMCIVIFGSIICDSIRAVLHLEFPYTLRVEIYRTVTSGAGLLFIYLLIVCLFVCFSGLVLTEKFKVEARHTSCTTHAQEDQRDITDLVVQVSTPA